MFRRRSYMDTPHWEDLSRRLHLMQEAVAVAAEMPPEDVGDWATAQQPVIAEARRRIAAAQAPERLPLWAWSALLAPVVIGVGLLASLLFPHPWSTAVWIVAAVIGCVVGGLALGARR